VEKTQISLIGCKEYEYGLLDQSLQRTLDLLGGIKNYVSPGEKILVKPNLLRPAKPEQAVTTHPLILQCIIEKLHDHGCETIIADSPGGPLNKPYLKRAYKEAGYIKVAEATGSELNYNTSTKLISSPNGKLIKAFDMIEVYDNVDGIISLPKFKTHVLTGITCAVKNLFGLIPGLKKPGYHKKLRDVTDFSEMLLDLNNLVKPRLSIVDAVTGMEGQGPNAGKPREIGLLMGGVETTALDMIASEITGITLDDISTLKAAKNRGYPETNMNNIEILGENLKDYIQKDFIHPKMGGNNILMNLLSSITTRFLIQYPQTTKACTACKICVNNCPMKTIKIKDNKAEIELKKCIRCYCCHEMCPHHAIKLKSTIIGRYIT